MAWVPVMDQLTGMSQCSAAPPSPLPFRPPPRLVRVGEQRCAIYGLRVWHDDGSGIVWYWNGRRHWDVVARGPSAASSLRNRKREVSLLVERERGGGAEGSRDSRREVRAGGWEGGRGEIGFGREGQRGETARFRCVVKNALINVGPAGKAVGY